MVKNSKVLNMCIIGFVDFLMKFVKFYRDAIAKKLNVEDLDAYETFTNIPIYSRQYLNP